VVLGPTQPTIQWVQGVKQPGHKVDHSSATIAKVKNMQIYMSAGYRCTFTLLRFDFQCLSYSQGRELDGEEIDETEEDDRTKFNDQLQTIGSFGRQVCQ
jgi:hypothetical protein